MIIDILLIMLIFSKRNLKNKIPHKIVIYENGDHLLLNYYNEVNKESID